MNNSKISKYPNETNKPNSDNLFAQLWNVVTTILARYAWLWNGGSDHRDKVINFRFISVLLSGESS